MILTATQAAERMGISQRKVYELADSGDLPCYRIGRAVRFAAADITEYLASCRSRRTRSAVAGALSLTATCQEPGGSALESAFRALGLAPKPTPSTGPRARASTRSQPASNVLKLASKTP